jgi:putative oxidoreductase
MTKIQIIHTLLSIALGIFFIYVGVKKFIPKPARSIPTEAYIQAIQANEYPKPISFKLAITMLKSSGFLYMVGVLQILSGFLILLSQTRLIGLLLLLPITVNIFTLHIFMDNRLDEDIETGLYLMVNLLLVAAYHTSLKKLISSKIDI